MIRSSLTKLDRAPLLPFFPFALFIVIRYKSLGGEKEKKKKNIGKRISFYRLKSSVLILTLNTDFLMFLYKCSTCVFFSLLFNDLAIFLLKDFSTSVWEKEIVNERWLEKDHWKDSPLSFFFSCETEALRSRIGLYCSRTLGEKLGQDLPQRRGRAERAPHNSRNRRNSCVRLTLVFLLVFPHSLLLWRPTMMNNAATPKDSREAVVCFVGGKIWMPSFLFVRTLDPPPPPFRFTCPPLRLFSSFGKGRKRDLSELRTINVCLKFPGKQRRHDKCIAFHRSSVSLDEKQPVSLESETSSSVTRLQTFIHREIRVNRYILRISLNRFEFYYWDDRFSCRVDRTGSMENWWIVCDSLLDG